MRDRNRNGACRRQDAPYFIGALLDGDEPQGGELLDFVRITNLFDTARSGALYLTASDSDSPYMDVIDGMATERSLCYPVMDGGMGSAGQVQVRRLWQHACKRNIWMPIRKRHALSALSATRNRRNDSFGLMLTLEETVGYPERLLVSFKVRSSKTSGSVPIRFGYTNRERRMRKMKSPSAGMEVQVMGHHRGLPGTVQPEPVS